MITDFPKEAQLVLDVIRKDVLKPEELPTSQIEDGNFLRFTKPDGDRACPMGLHPKARSTNPMGAWSFPMLKPFEQNYIINAFAQWWDKQTDAQAAVDFVWPNDA